MSNETHIKKKKNSKKPQYCCTKKINNCNTKKIVCVQQILL